jgi:hypothetical protein
LGEIEKYRAILLVCHASSNARSAATVDEAASVTGLFTNSIAVNYANVKPTF